MTAIAQVELKGTVYDRSQLYPLAGVSVLSTSGAGTATVGGGGYRIWLTKRDSISFSYLGKATAKIPIKNLDPNLAFDMSLQVDAVTMASVLVWSRNYREDSALNRAEYQKVFNYGKTYVDNMKMDKRGAGLGVGLDFDMMFDGGANRRMLAFQKRLEDEEKDKYIDHRFTKALVKRVTGLEPPALDTFMREYRPTYEFLQTFETDYEFYKFISESAKYFSENWRKEHTN
jgi:hypothetical protein